MYKRKNTEPVIGITHVNNLQSWFWDELENGIDVQWESIVADVTEEVKAEIEAGEISENDLENEIENRLESIDVDGENASVLLGDWFKDENGVYQVNPNGPAGFAAHYSGSMGGIVSVEYSRYTRLCHQTSPCFIMSDGTGFCGDLDTPGDYSEAYSLPPEWFLENEEENEEV